jgi:hypothetical protein
MNLERKKEARSWALELTPVILGVGVGAGNCEDQRFEFSPGKFVEHPPLLPPAKSHGVMHLPSQQ